VSVVCLWYPKFIFCLCTLVPIVSTLSVVVFRCLWSVCGLSVVPKDQNMTVYTTYYRFHPVCGRFQVSLVCLWSVCGAQSLNSVNLHFLLSFPPCLLSFLGVCGLSMLPKLQIMSIYTSFFRFHPVCGHFYVSVVCLWSVCGAKTSDSIHLHFLLSSPPCLWSFLGVCGLSVVSVVGLLWLSFIFYQF
jgi:uncharacterized membrane protein